MSDHSARITATAVGDEINLSVSGNGFVLHVELDLDETARLVDQLVAKMAVAKGWVPRRGLADLVG